MIALILSLGMDTLMMSISLGFVKPTDKMKFACIFAGAEAVMPLIGLVMGKAAGQFIGEWASLAGGSALLAIAVWLIFFEDEDKKEGKLARDLIGRTLLITALSISIDELAVGFSIGLVGVPIALTITLVALQSFVFTYMGITFGVKLKPYLGEWAEKLAGVALGILGLWILSDTIWHFIYRYLVHHF
jgi:putative Mn2+ efflux pump MntP